MKKMKQKKKENKKTMKSLKKKSPILNQVESWKKIYKMNIIIL